MTYVALLRGINVGGKAKVPMAQLRTGFEELGCTDVISYINSGNVFFKDKRSAKQLVPLIEKNLFKDFGIDIKVLLRNRKQIDELCKKIPAKWTNDTVIRTDVIFLWDEIDEPGILKKIRIKPEVERVRYLPGALVWNIDRKDVNKASETKLIGTEIYKLMTIRNINTVRKLQILMAQTAPGTQTRSQS